MLGAAYSPPPFPRSDRPLVLKIPFVCMTLRPTGRFLDTLSRAYIVEFFVTVRLNGKLEGKNSTLKFLFNQVHYQLFIVTFYILDLKKEKLHLRIPSNNIFLV